MNVLALGRVECWEPSAESQELPSLKCSVENHTGGFADCPSGTVPTRGWGRTSSHVAQLVFHGR